MDGWVVNLRIVWLVEVLSDWLISQRETFYYQCDDDFGVPSCGGLDTVEERKR